jgi:hypothetical protein
MTLGHQDQPDRRLDAPWIQDRNLFFLPTEFIAMWTDNTKQPGTTIRFASSCGISGEMSLLGFGRPRAHGLRLLNFPLFCKILTVGRHRFQPDLRVQISRFDWAPKQLISYKIPCLLFEIDKKRERTEQINRKT